MYFRNFWVKFIDEQDARMRKCNAETAYQVLALRYGAETDTTFVLISNEDGALLWISDNMFLLDHIEGEQRIR